MAENLTLARPYAEAAFLLAKSASDLPAWSTTLAQLAAVTTSEQMIESIGNPLMSPEQLTQLCIQVASGNAAISTDQQNFVRVLVDNQRLSVLSEISALFDLLKHDHEGVKDAEITSAFALDETTLKTLVADLERKFSCRIEVSVKVDASLIGGVRIAVGDEVIDASVRGKLAAMATALKN